MRQAVFSSGLRVHRISGEGEQVWAFVRFGSARQGWEHLMAAFFELISWVEVFGASYSTEAPMCHPQRQGYLGHKMSAHTELGTDPQWTG